MLSYFASKLSRPKKSKGNDDVSSKKLPNQEKKKLDDGSSSQHTRLESDDSDEKFDNSSASIYDDDDDDDDVEGEIIFCKNNVRARQPYCRDVIVDGYLTLRTCYDDNHLVFRWLPNQLIFDTSISDDEELGVNDSSLLFEVDTRNIKTIKLFFDSDNFCSGQVVFKNLQNQYKVFQFQYGGLNRLCRILEDKYSCTSSVPSSPEVNTRHYEISTTESQTLYHQYPNLHPINYQVWQSLFDNAGRLVRKTQLKEAVFYGGIEQEIRKEVWKFLLKYYSYDSTREQRLQLQLQRRQIYEDIDVKRQAMSGEDKNQFYRKVECIVEKDVVRTDCGSEYYSGSDNPNVQTLRRILLNYAVDNPIVGYTQGMSDLLAPVLAIMDDETDAYWCFTGLMEKSVFLNTPQNDMEEQLGLLRELLRTLLPNFYAHFMKHNNGIELLFCHRWLLLCFRRELTDSQAHRVWEACWSHQHTQYFHLFLCAAAIAEYGQSVIEKNLPADLTLLHFTSILSMDGDQLLRGAQSLLHNFLVQDIIPCTLMNLLSDPGDWDSPPTPKIYCKCDGFHASSGIPTLLEVVQDQIKHDNDSKDTSTDQQGTMGLSLNTENSAVERKDDIDLAVTTKAEELTQKGDDSEPTNVNVCHEDLTNVPSNAIDVESHATTDSKSATVDTSSPIADSLEDTTLSTKVTAAQENEDSESREAIATDNDVQLQDTSEVVTTGQGSATDTGSASAADQNDIKASDGEDVNDCLASSSPIENADDGRLTGTFDNNETKTSDDDVNDTYT